MFIFAPTNPQEFLRRVRSKILTVKKTKIIRLEVKMTIDADINNFLEDRKPKMSLINLPKQENLKAKSYIGR